MASRLSSMTMRRPLRLDSLRPPLMPTMRFASTSSLTFSRSRSPDTMYGSCVMTMRVPRLVSSISAWPRTLTVPRPVS